jgi:hypothetical protein
VSEVKRLAVLQGLLPQARSLHVFSDDGAQSSAWVLDFGSARLTLALSAETWRGFSGEGQGLRALMRQDDSSAAVLASVRAGLNWQSALDVEGVSQALGAPSEAVGDAFRVLGSSGLVGFDVFEGNYFHRVLPLDLSLVEELNPRLLDARELLRSGAVCLKSVEPLVATVVSGETIHYVREVEGELRCTCPWFAKHLGQRGPCKHVLAVEASRSTSMPA